MVPLLPLLGLALSASLPPAPAPPDNPLAASLPLNPAPADEPTRAFDYDYVEVDYVHTDLSGVPGTQDGLGMQGSFQFFNHFFLQGTVIAGRGDVDVDNYKVGLGFHLGLMDRLDALAVLSYLHRHFHSAFDDDGYELDLGPRFMLTDKIELNGLLEFRHLEDDSVGVQFGGRYYLSGPFSLGASFETIDSDNTFQAGVRFQF
jgi:hypothetical protein